MKDAPSITLKRWIGERCGRAVADDTPLLEEELITSFDLVELILIIEELRGNPIDLLHLAPGSFASVAQILKTFFAEHTHV
ncbi:MAG TPA: hypothetical protein VKT70_09655 [Stellaceae bacterium]|nr:hypothetical protein [Stellaceae bacterium]